MLFNLRIKLIRWLIGPLSIVANVAISDRGVVYADDGLIYNSGFGTHTPPTEKQIIYCGRIAGRPDNHLILDGNVFL